MNRLTANKPALLMYTGTLILMALFSLTGLAQDAQISSSPELTDNQPSRNGQITFVTLEPIFFDFDQATLSDQSKKTLDEAAHYILNQHGVSRILIEGHTDSQASSAYNQKLAGQRATAVRDYLTRQGIDDTLFHLSALGENFPIDENWTREGQRRNRHVRIHLITLLLGENFPADENYIIELR